MNSKPTFRPMTAEQADALELFIPEGADRNDRLKAACRLLAVRYGTLARATGLAKLRLERIFNERATATPDELARIVAALGLSVRE